MTDPYDPASALRAARAHVFDEIARACERVGRDPTDVALVAVSKTVSAERVRAALAVGLETFGENRVQEAEGKVAAVAGGTWHLIGPLQSNKARRAIEIFDVIESVDSIELAQRLDRIAAELRPGRPLPVLIQVNVDRDPAKAGMAPEALAAAVPAILDCRSLRVDGLMTIGRLVETAEEARPAFRALRQLAAGLRERHPGLGPELSMGMTDDFPVAVEEGATIVRVGRAIFGERPPTGMEGR